MRVLFFVFVLSLPFNCLATEKVEKQKEKQDIHRELQKQLTNKLNDLGSSEKDEQILAYYDFLFKLKRDAYFSQKVPGVNTIQLISRSDLERNLKDGTISEVSKQRVLVKLKQVSTHISLLVQNDSYRSFVFKPTRKIMDFNYKCENIICDGTTAIVAGSSALLGIVAYLPLLPNLLINRMHLKDSEEEIENTLRGDISDLEARSSHQVFTEMSNSKLSSFGVKQ